MTIKPTKTQSRIAAKLEEQVKRLNNLRPVAQLVGEYVTRAARRRAPRGDSNRGASLSTSLNHVEPAHNITVLRSDKRYARIQNFGGTIVAGTGPLKSKMLAIPLTDFAKRMIAFMGASTSLRDAPVKMFPLRLNGKLFLARKRSGNTATYKDRRGREKKRREFLQALQVTTGRGKNKRTRLDGDVSRENMARTLRGGSKAKVVSFEVLFLLKRSVRLQPNPAPQGYAPRLSEPAVAAFVGRAVANHLRKGAAQ